MDWGFEQLLDSSEERGYKDREMWKIVEFKRRKRAGAERRDRWRRFKKSQPEKRERDLSLGLFSLLALSLSVGIGGGEEVFYNL